MVISSVMEGGANVVSEAAVAGQPHGIIITIMINMLMPVKLNSFAHLRVLLVLHDCGILAHATTITGYYSSN
jgi:hypothetical protein